MSDPVSILEGVRVVEVATFVFAPAAGTVMADFGADVVHVEPPGMGDPHRYLQHLKPLPTCEHNYPWLLTSRGKRSAVLDLKSPAGHEALLTLVRRADVFITNYHPSVLGTLQLRYEDLEPENARLVYAHATGYGETGAEAEKPGYDATAWWARSGLMDAVRAGEEGEPCMAPPAMGDQPSAMTLFGAIMLGLYARDRSGRGTKVSSSLIANGAWANGLLLQAAMCGAENFLHVDHATTPNALVNHYATADGRRFYLAMVKEAGEWGRFCDAIEEPALRSDPRFAKLEDRRRNAPALIAILDGVFRRRTLADWRQRLDRHGVTFGVIARSDEVPRDEQLRANRVFAPLEHPDLGAIDTVDSPIQMRGARKRTPTLAPKLGEHTDEVLREVGFDPARLGDG